MKKSSKKENNNNTKKGLFKIVLLMVIGVLFISSGIFLSIMTTPKNIMKTAIDRSFVSIKNIFLVDKTVTDLGSNYTVESKINLKLDGTLFSTPEMASYKNFNNTNTEISFSQNLDNKKLLFKAKSNINNNELFDYKYLIEESTGYFYLKEFSDNYINVGSNNYFENIPDNSYENYKYLIEKTLDSIANNISKTHLSKENVNTTIDDKGVNLVKTTYVIDNKELIDLLNGVQKDLKSDQKAKEIITNINKDFFDKSISNDRTLLSKNEFIMYSVYTDKLYRVKKIELTAEENNKDNTISYEVLKDSYLVKIINEDVVDTKYYITQNNNKYNISIRDGSSKELGKVEFENTEKKKTFSYQMMDEDYKIDLNYNRNLNNIVNNKSYKSKGTLNLNVTDLKSTDKLLVLSIDMDSKYSNKSSISENTSKSLLKSSFSKEENDKLNNVIANILSKIIGSEMYEKA